MRFRASRLVGSLLVVLIALLLSVSLAIAKGPPSRVSIAGPGLTAPVEVDDPAVLEAFSFFQFEEVENRIDAPADPGQGYTVTRYVEAADGSYRPWDVVIYYPAARDGQSVAYLEGLLGEDMATQFDGDWYSVSSAGERAMRGLLGGRQDRALDHVAQFSTPRYGHCNDG